MPKIIEVTVPDIGDFQSVEVIEILVKPGDKIQKDDSLVSLESEKATMEIPSSHAGVVKALKLKVGDKVSQGSLILTLEAEQESAPDMQPKAPGQPATEAATTISEAEIQADVVVLGAGPGGYTAAFRAADLGKKVVLIERYPSLGGVCLNVGCIPSKALLHVAKVISEAEEVSHHGVSFGKPKIDIDQVRAWKESVVTKLTGGLGSLAKQRNVRVIRGVGQFVAPHHIRVETADGEVTVAFDNAIVAAGSQAVKIPAFPVDPRVIDSTGALQLADVPKRMLVIGGGIIGLEMATVYHALGTKITVVERGPQLMPGADPDIVKPLLKRIEKRYEAILLNTSVAALEAKKDGILATFGGDNAPAPQLFDRVLVAVGRSPNGKLIGAENAGIRISEQGFIPVDKQQRTNIPHIFAIGDIVGQPMLAHKAVHEGKVAAEVIAGHKAAFDPSTIPSVAYTDPEVAWMGL
ncbi:MAG: FAD-dependent oxidoreductase, partial [Sulfuricella sp.]|nr:FAD-dependent oxidoreductase [Sulfuricella sp.]